MSSLLEKYLHEVGCQMRSLPPLIREGELRETEAHLQQLIDDLKAQGYDEEAAFAEAIKRFGAARRVGLRLRDVWEGNRSLLLVLMVFISGNLLLYSGMIQVGKLMIEFLSATQPQLLMLPPIGYIFWSVSSLFFICPILLNYALGRWAGRRAIPAAIFSGLIFFSGSLKMILDAVPFSVGTITICAKLLCIYIPPSLGAWFGALQMRRRRLALVSGCASQEEAARLLTQWLLRHPNWRRITVWVLSLAVMACGLTIYVRHQINITLHPPSPEIAVAVRLNSLGVEDRQLLGATNVVTNVLPAITPAEKAGRQRRVFYTATMHAEEGYRKQRIAFLKRHLAAIRAGESPDDPKSVRHAINRLRPEGYALHGIARVDEAPDGWHWHIGGSMGNQPWAWLYDIYYEDRIQALQKDNEEHIPRD